MRPALSGGSSPPVKAVLTRAGCCLALIALPQAQGPVHVHVAGAVSLELTLAGPGGLLEA